MLLDFLHWKYIDKTYSIHNFPYGAMPGAVLVSPTEGVAKVLYSVAGENVWDIDEALWPPLLTWFNFNPSMDK